MSSPESSDLPSAAKRWGPVVVFIVASAGAAGVVGGIVAGVFGLQTKEAAAAEHAAIRLDCGKSEILEKLGELRGELREDIGELRGELRSLRRGRRRGR